MKKVIILLLFLCFCLSGYSQYEDAEKYAKTITEEDLRDYLTILASDAMEGRETGERGQKMAAAFIAYHFQELGLQPVVKNGDNYSYYQKFELEKNSPGETYLKVKGKKLMNGEDIVYWGRSNMKAEKAIEAVFLGKGNAESLKVKQVKDKAAVAMTIGSGLQQWRTISSKMNTADAAITFLVVAKTNKEFAKQLSQFKRNFMRSSIGFGREEKTPGGTFLISLETAANIFGVEPDMLTKAAKEFEAGQKGALGQIRDANIEYLVTREKEVVMTENVLGLLEGSDKKDEIVIISAHYDHIGKRGKEINNGADDDGSGSSSVLEIAEAFVEAKNAGNGPRRSILFITVTGEEKGLLGSQFYVENPVFPLENTVVNLNIDMIGRFDPEHEENREFMYLVGSDRLSTELHELSEKTNDTFTGLYLDYTYNDENHPDRIYYRSDHWNFAKNGIPIIFYFTGIHEDYHKSSDTVDKIEFELLQRRTSLIYHTAWVLANKEERLVVDKLQETTIDRGN